MILGDSENNDFISDVLDLNKECFSNIRYSRNVQNQNITINNNFHEEINPVNNQLLITSNLPTNNPQTNPILNSQINQNINLQINQNLNHQLNQQINQQINNQENNPNLNIFQFVDQFNNFNNSPNQINQNISTTTKLICTSPNNINQENIILPIKVENAIDLTNTNIPNSLMNTICCDKFQETKKYVNSTDQLTLNLPTTLNDLSIDNDFKQINQIDLNKDSDIFKNWNQSNQSKSNLSPIDMEDQERIKLERKRMRNRIAASKCRRKKMEKINKLEEYNNCLKNEIDLLRKTINKLHKQNATLKDQLVLHVNSGCELSSVGFNPYDQAMVN